MVNWKVFKITKKSLVYSDCGPAIFIHFRLDGNKLSEDFSEYGINFIFCNNSYPFNTYKVGDSVEIDQDKTICERADRIFNEIDGAVRKFESSSLTGMVIGSTTITREHGLAIARQLDEYVDQSGGRNEYTASIEVQDERGKPIKFSISSKRANYNN